jgi:hypothetical protein
VPADVTRINDGQSHCRLADPNGGTLNALVTEIGLQGALLSTQVQIETNAYIDITLVLRNLAPRQLFAHVVSCGPEGLRLRWLHFDPGEEGKLRSLLETYARNQGALAGPAGPAGQASKNVKEGAPAVPGGGTRRVVKPRTESGDSAPVTEMPGSTAGSGTRRLVRPSATAITPFSDASPMAAGEAGRIGTRRVVRPSQQALTPFADVPKSPTAPGEESRSGIGEDSRTHQVVIETTDRFEKLIDVGIDSGKPVAKAASAPAERPAPPAPEGHAPAAQAPSPGEESGGHALAPSDGPAGASEPAAAPAVAAKTTIIGRDGRMDIGASIRSHAKTVRASELAARHDRVRVLNMGTIKSLIQEAVEEAAAHLTRSLNESERKRLLEEAEEGFQERLKAFQAEKEGAEQKTKRLTEQLEAARRLLDEERKRTIKADQFTVSAEGLGEIEDRFKRLLNRSITEGGIAPELEEQLRTLIAHILDSERDKIRERELEAQNAKIALLEKKVGRLAGTLEETERQRDEAQRFAAFLESQGGGALRNVFTAGLKDEDPNKGKKLELMKKILDENRMLRQSLGISLADPNAPDTTIAPVPTEATTTPIGRGTTDTEKFRREVKQDVQDLKQSAAELAPPEEPAAEDSGGAAEEAVPETNPDDEPWEFKPLADPGPGATVTGIKRISIPVSPSSAPPLERGKSGGGK